MESTTVMVILVPLIVKVFPMLGISPIHFGIITVLCTEMALITPPIGANLYVMSSVANVPIDQMIRQIWPFVGVVFLGLIIITFIPGISLWLPTFLGMLK
jgi:C4-dicarboxylate transporter DctM subunit